MRNIYLDFSIPEIKQKIESGEISCNELGDTTIRAIKKYESDTLAWVSYDLDKVKTESERVCSNNKMLSNNLSLLGIPFGVKDIFNTIDYPTEMGSPIWKGYTAGNNARVVDSLLSSGGFIAGKTVTAEFAVHSLNKTLNPHDILRTPGTSSSGSAAAIARGMVPFSLATQTAGSIIRPASFCGIWGMKPSFGMIPRTGSLKTTDSLDSIGYLAAHGKSLRPILDSVRVEGPDYPYVFKNIDCRGAFPKDKKQPWRVGFVKTHVWDKATTYTQKAVETLVTKISEESNFEIEEIKWPQEFHEVHMQHSCIYNKSLSYYFKIEKEKKLKMTPLMLKMIDKGESVSLDDYRNALIYQENFCKNVDNLFKPYDFIISLATAGSAPLREDATIDDPSLIWTFAHIPSISAPVFRSPEGLPFGVQLISRKWNDYLLLQGVEDLIDLNIVPVGSKRINE